MLLVAALGYAAWRQQQAVEEGQRALRMQTFLYRLFKLANSNYTGKPAATVPEFLNLGVKILPDYIKNPGDLREAQLALAESMYENNDLDDAQQVFTQVTASSRAAGDIASQVEAEAFSGNIAYRQGQYDAGAKLTQESLDLSRRRGVPSEARVWSDIFFAWNRDNNGFRSDDNVRLLENAVAEAQRGHLSAHETADALYNLGEDYELRGRLDDAERTFRAALASYGNDPSSLCDRSAIDSDIAYVMDMRGRHGEQPADLRAGPRRLSEVFGRHSKDALEGQEFVASTLIKLGRAQEALPMLEQDMPEWRKFEGGTPDLSEPLYFLSLAELETGHFREAEQHANEMLAIQTGKVAPTDRRFGATHWLIARALAGEHRYAEALPHAEIGADLLSRNAISPGAKKAGAQARQLLDDLKTRLGVHN